MATLARAKVACQALPGATSDIKWGADLVFSVGAKMFAAMPSDARDPTISFKVDDHRFLELTDREGFEPAPYLARAKWVLVRDLGKVSDAELKSLLVRSHAIIAGKLPARTRKALGVEA
jgi:predicted DNA-binding protein (MmcQ/YjbR family)